MKHMHIGCRNCNYWFHLDNSDGNIHESMHCGICGQELQRMLDKHDGQ